MTMGRVARIVRRVVIGVGGLLVAVQLFGYFGGAAARTSCSTIASQAQEISKSAKPSIVSVSNVSEFSHDYGRGESERRCLADAVFSDGEHARLYIQMKETPEGPLISYSDRAFK